MSYRQIVLRLTDRPEIERSPWLVHPDWESVTVTCREGRVEFRPTGHEADGLEVWVPRHRKADWPPHPRRLVDVLKDEED